MKGVTNDDGVQNEEPVDAHHLIQIKAGLSFQQQHVAIILFWMYADNSLVFLDFIIANWSLVDFKIRINESSLLDRVRPTFVEASVDTESFVWVDLLRVDFGVPIGVGSAGLIFSL